LCPARRLLRVENADGSKSEGSAVSLPYRAEVKTDCEGSASDPHDVHTAEPTWSSHMVPAPHWEQGNAMEGGTKECGVPKSRVTHTRKLE